MTRNKQIALGLVLTFLGGMLAGYELHALRKDPIIAQREAAQRAFEEELRQTRERLEAQPRGRGVQEILGLRPSN